MYAYTPAVSGLHVTWQVRSGRARSAGHVEPCLFRGPIVAVSSSGSKFDQPCWILCLQHPCPTRRYVFLSMGPRRLRAVPLLGVSIAILSEPWRGEGAARATVPSESTSESRRRPSRASASPESLCRPSHASMSRAPSAGWARQIGDGQMMTHKWVPHPAYSPPLVSAIAAIGAESEYIKGVKACRAEPGHSTARAPC